MAILHNSSPSSVFVNLCALLTKNHNSTIEIHIFCGSITLCCFEHWYCYVLLKFQRDTSFQKRNGWEWQFFIILRPAFVEHWYCYVLLKFIRTRGGKLNGLPAVQDEVNAARANCRGATKAKFLWSAAFPKASLHWLRARPLHEENFGISAYFAILPHLWSGNILWPATIRVESYLFISTAQSNSVRHSADWGFERSGANGHKFPSKYDRIPRFSNL